MARTATYYSTQPFLAWCLNHFFFGQRHFAYVGAPFHPYRRRNPASSNPWKTYGAQYEPWVDRDPYDAHIEQKRRNLRKGIAAHSAALHPLVRVALDAICGSGDIIFFVPVVYRVDVATLDGSRLKRAGSGSVGSREYLIQDLAEAEFDVLFFHPGSDDLLADPDLTVLGRTLLGQPDILSPRQALQLLWTRRSP